MEGQWEIIAKYFSKYQGQRNNTWVKEKQVGEW